MTQTVFGIFTERADAENALRDLETNGYNPKDISIVMQDQDEAKDMASDTGANVAGGAASGATAGLLIGGAAGLLAATVIPGIGAFLIGGPIAAALGLTGAAASTASGAVTGAVAGGLIGALTGLGLSKDEAQEYETRIKEGAILVAVPSRGENNEVTDILTAHNATDIRSVTNEG